MQTSPRFYHPELDGLRFIAFLLVFIHNANLILQGTFLEKFSEYSWFGVDLFFCLSGYLITKLLMTEHKQTGKINIRNFYMRRALRIVPLYFFYIIVGSIIIAPVEGRNINLIGNIAALATFSYNFAYFALLPSPIFIFIHLWSISFEGQFYTCIPWLLKKILLETENIQWLFLGVLFIFGNLLRALFIYFQLANPWIYFLPITHFDSILGGVVLGLGLLDRHLNKASAIKLLLLGLGSLSLIFFLPNIDVTSWGLMITYPAIGLGVSLIICSILLKKALFLQIILGNRSFAYFGKISYGLYIFHIGFLTITTTILSQWLGLQQLSYPKHTILVLTVGLLLTILFSIVSFNILEKPFLKLKVKFGLLSPRSN